MPNACYPSWLYDQLEQINFYRWIIDNFHENVQHILISQPSLSKFMRSQLEN